MARCIRCDGRGRLTAHSVSCVLCNGTGESTVRRVKPFDRYREDNALVVTGPRCTDSASCPCALCWRKHRCGEQ